MDGLEQPTVVYADVLFAINCLAHFLLLHATARLTKTKAVPSLFLLSSLCAGGYSLTFLMGEIPIWSLVSVRFLWGGVLIVLAFPYVSLATYLRQYAVFLGVNILAAGIVLALRSKNGRLYLRNGIVYYDMSLFSLALGMVLAYFLVRALCAMLKNQPEKEQFASVTLTINQNSVELLGFWDTGNGLRDYFSGLPVVVCEYRKAAPYLTREQREFVDLVLSGPSLHPPERDSLAHCGMRLVFYNSAKDEGVLPALKPDYFAIKKDGEDIPCQVLAAFSQRRFLGGKADLLLNRHLSTQISHQS